MAETFIDNFNRREVIASREVALHDLERFRTLFATGEIIEEMELSSLRVTSQETKFGDVREVHPDFLPIDARASLRGIDFDHLDVTLQGQELKHQSVEVRCFAAEPEDLNRIITLSGPDDDDFLDVTDSHSTLAQLKGVELAPQVKRRDIALWLARISLIGEEEAFRFVQQSGRDALAAAANLTSLRAGKKVQAISTGKQFTLNGNRAMIQTHTLKSYQADEAFSYPENQFPYAQNQIDSLWLIEPHAPKHPNLKGLPIVRRTLIEYSPTNTELPGAHHKDSESFRIELSGKAGTDTEALEIETGRLAENYGPRLLHSVKQTLRAVTKTL